MVHLLFDGFAVAQAGWVLRGAPRRSEQRQRNSAPHSGCHGGDGGHGCAVGTANEAVTPAEPKMARLFSMKLLLSGQRAGTQWAKPGPRPCNETVGLYFLKREECEQNISACFRTSLKLIGFAI